MKSRYNKKLVVASIVVFALLVVAASVVGILKTLNVFSSDISTFGIIYVILTIGAGVYVLGLGLVTKGGYETAVGSILTTLGVVYLLAALKVDVVIVVIVAVAMVLLTLLGLLLVKADLLHVQRADEKEGYKPYMEKLQEQKAQEKKDEEDNPVPEIKSFKD